MVDGLMFRTYYRDGEGKGRRRVEIEIAGGERREIVDEELPVGAEEWRRILRYWAGSQFPRGGRGGGS